MKRIKTKNNKGLRVEPRARAITVAVLVGLFTAPYTCAQEWVYTVRPGDTLWDLSGKYLKRGIAYTERVRQLNSVPDPYRLQPGRKLRFPLRWLKVQPVSVTVESVSGDVQFVPAGSGSLQSVAATAALNTGDRLIVGDQGGAVLRFADGSQMIVRANSEVIFDTLTAYGDTGMVDTRARLQRGRVDARALPARGAGTRYEISTPAAVSAVRGTQYRVSADAESSVARTEVLRGTVAVSGSGRTQNVPERFGVVAKVGTPPDPPRPLLAAPDLSRLPRLVERDPVNLTWPALADADRYRMQLARSSAFENLLVDKISTSPSTGGVRLAEDGEYYFRVRGIDGLGLEGLDGTHAFTLNARPEPPFPLEPRNDALTRSPRTAYRWTVPASAVGYRLQVARDAGFSDLIEDRELTPAADYESTEVLPPGTYYWRLATQDAAGEEGPFSEPRAFTYRPLPPSPDTDPPSLTDDAVEFSWRAGAAGQTYQFQVASDREFQDLLVDERLDEPEYRLPLPDPGTYYMRVAGVDSDGTMGTFGDTQQFGVSWDKAWIPITGWIGLLLLLAL